MSETMQKAKVVHVLREQGEGNWFYASSPELPGLLATAPTLDALDRIVPDAILISTPLATWR